MNNKQHRPSICECEETLADMLHTAPWQQTHGSWALFPATMILPTMQQVPTQ